MQWAVFHRKTVNEANIGHVCEQLCTKMHYMTQLSVCQHRQLSPVSEYTRAPRDTQMIKLEHRKA
eukprot:1142241-Pelagomonas_calceolata.AAC.1